MIKKCKNPPAPSFNSEQNRRRSKETYAESRAVAKRIRGRTGKSKGGSWKNYFGI